VAWRVEDHDGAFAKNIKVFLDQRHRMILREGGVAAGRLHRAVARAK